jgi:IclR family transcriptional regulator, KDG regulon repressor
LDRVERVISILNYLAESGKPCEVREISADLDIEKSSVSRVLSALKKLKWVEQFPDSTYGLGDKPLEFGLTIISRLDLRKVSQPFLAELNNITHETAGLTIRMGLEEIYLDQVESKFPVRHVLQLGDREVLSRGATGKAMLAYMDRHEAEKVIEHLRNSGKTVLISGKTLIISKLLDELVEIKKQGFAISIAERSQSSACVASPIIDHNNIVTGCISVTGPLPRFNEETARGYGPLLKKAAQEISVKLGSNYLL